MSALLFHADYAEPALTMTDAATLAFFFVSLEISIGGPVHGAIGAVKVADAAADAAVLVPPRKPPALISGAEGAGRALIEQRALNHLLCEFCRFQNPSPFTE